MLKFEKNPQKTWYNENKKFLREFERTKEFNDYRNIREKLRKNEKKIKFLKEFYNKSGLVYNHTYLTFFRDELRRLKKVSELHNKSYEKSFIIMKKAKSEAELLYLRQKIKILEGNKG